MLDKHQSQRKLGERMANRTVRKLKAAEQHTAYHLIQRGFDRFVRADFTPAGTKEFLSASKRMLTEQDPELVVLVAEADGDIEGVMVLKQHSHISLFFVDPDKLARGIGRSLLEHAIGLSLQSNPHLKTIDVNSSPWAVPVYQKLGFVQTKPLQEIKGIRFVEMVRPLP